MTGDDDVRTALRGLLPDYEGPADPYVRVAAAVRRRRRTVRTRLAVAGTAAAAAAAAVVAPVVLLGGGGAGGTTPAAPGGSYAPVGAVQAVAAGSVASRRWTAGSTAASKDATRCLFGDGGPMRGTLVCFDDWTPADGASWVVVADERRGTAVLGVVPADVRRATVVFADGGTARLDPRRTATDGAVGFFAVVVAGDRAVAGVTLQDGAGRALAPTDTDPDDSGCPTGPDVACGTPLN